ncbi:MAG: rhomboid family intramembrane serine protease [Deltaproteobacteria bacterium]|nr:rhomboid family intramembrane serine protease [Deltaproteobacteria bacterium]
MIFPLRGAPVRRYWPYVTLGLIAANVALFAYQLYIGPKASLYLFAQKGAVAAKLSQVKLSSVRQVLGLVPTMFTSLFLHAGWVHLLGNMWFLWVFGEGLEDELGHWRFLAFYFFCGFFSCIFHILAASSLTAPLIGASGAIAGVLGGYMWLRPKSPIYSLSLLRLQLEFTDIPAYVWLGIWLALQFYGLRQGGAVAWMAHLGGFFVGLFTVTLFTPITSAPAPIPAPAKSRSNPKGKSRRGKKK